MTSRHPTWCAGGHHCGHGEHRANPVTITAPGAGSLTLTRMRAGGAEWAEVRLSIALAGSEPVARQQLTALLTHLQTLIGPARPTRRAA
jgi:hypothetical protein